MELCVIDRLKREDCTRTKHDSAFSEWKILVGPSDWEDYYHGKEGVAKYRTENLPTSSCPRPGVYELGIALPVASSGRKLDQNRIVVVYLGQSVNVRTRLQEYGRSGAHLGNSYSTDSKNGNKNLSLQKESPWFVEMFSKGYSLVYRWAPMKSKSDAEKTESKLLDRFDYALNRGRNGASRFYDILEKLNTQASRPIWSPKIIRKIQHFSQKPVGIKIEVCKPNSMENKCTFHNYEEVKKPLSRNFIFSKSRPRLNSEKSHVEDMGWKSTRFEEYSDSKIDFKAAGHPAEGDLLPICGVILIDGNCCRKPPVPGRVRCEEHKGRKLCGSVSQRTTIEKSSYLPDIYVDSSTRNCQEESSICGVELGNGRLCAKQPVAQRKRCDEHKGLRVNSLVGKSSEKSKLCEPEVLPWFSVVEDRRAVYNEVPRICGASTRDGNLCQRKPAEGCVRCWQHKGNLCEPEVLPRFSVVKDRRAVYNEVSTICGAITRDGNLCQRKPAERCVRCWQHKGMRA